VQLRRIFVGSIDQYVQLTGIDGEVMELKYTTKDMGKIGSGSYSDASFS